jgi:hypothetical protein
MKINKNFLESAEETASELNIKFVPWTYSGRGMFGKECFGVVTDRPEAISMILFATFVQIETDRDIDWNGHWGILQLLKRSRIDSMGLESIVYYENVQIDDEDEEDEEEEEEVWDQPDA